MKYIRIEDGVYIFEDFAKTRGKVCLNHYGYQNKNGVCILGTLKDWKDYKKAETIEDLCDELVVVQKDFHDLLNADTHCLQTLKRYYEINKIEVLGIYGAIWTDKGLIYVAKMNEKGELELL